MNPLSLLGFTALLFCWTFLLVLGAPTDKPLDIGQLVLYTPTDTTPEKSPEIGPRRKALNETGRYLYQQPITNDGYLLCKTCSKRALRDSTYSKEQQFTCINQNLDKPGSNETSPFCNVGEDLGCGPVPFNHTNSVWNCDTGYSDAIHTVYSTCTLVCNTNLNTIGRIYCAETLEWVVDEKRLDDCTGPVNKEDDSVVTHVLIGIGSGLIVGMVILLLICCWMQRRKPSRPSTPVTEMIPMKNKPISGDNTPSTIGSCSIEGERGDEQDEESPLLMSQEEKPKPQKVTTSTSTSSLNTDGLNGLNSSKTIEDNSLQHGVDCNDGNLPASRTSTSSNKSDASQTSSGRMDTTEKLSSEKPFLKIFCDHSDRTSESRLGSGLNNMILQDTFYRALSGSSVYMVPSREVDSLRIERKDDGPAFRGTPFLAGSQSIVLEQVTREDAGVYRWTMRVGGEEFHGVFQLFIGSPETYSVEVREGNETRTSLPLEDNRNQQSAMEPVAINHEGNHNTVNHNEDQQQQQQQLQQQQVNQRLPPEGAENDDHQVSGRGNQNFNGARPKTYNTQVNKTNTVVSGGSGMDVKDLPRMKSLRNNLVNDLDKMKEESENNLNKLDSPRNISEDKQNIFSLENNEDSSNEQSSNSANTTSTLDFNTILSESEISTTDNSGGLISRDKDKMKSSEHNSAEHSQGGESLRLTSVPPLDFDTFNSSKCTLSIDNNRDIIDDELEESKDSVELPMDILELKDDLDLSGLLDSGNQIADSGINVNSANYHISEGQGQSEGLLRSLSHLNPRTIDPELGRPEPSGRSDQQVLVENRPALDQTRLKLPYSDEDVRAERSFDSSPPQPLANVKLETNVRREQGTSHEEDSRNPRPVPNHHGDREQPIRELDQPVRGAVGGVVTSRTRLTEERCQAASGCITHLKQLTDCNCLEQLSYRANPRETLGDAHSWFGLSLHYGYKRYMLKAVESASKSQYKMGPMYVMVTDFMAKDNFTVGHIVSYFTEISPYKEIVDLLIDECKDHRNCDYCERLRRRCRQNS